jgi:hypothetical protein
MFKSLKEVTAVGHCRDGTPFAMFHSELPEVHL